MDWTVLDLEHGEATEADLLALLYAVATTPMAAVVRPQSVERLRVGGALDLGASGIVLPQPRSIEQVREAVSFLRYPPMGVRGVALRTAARASARSPTRTSLASSTSSSSGSCRSSRWGRSPPPTGSRRTGRGRRPVRRPGRPVALALERPGRFDDPTYLDA